MRVLFSISLSIILSLPIYSQWEIINEQTADLDKIQFVNDYVGWMTGYQSLFKTEDGGETWTPIPLTTNWEFLSIDFFNDTLGWATIHDGINFLVKTDNGGITWTKSFTLGDSYHLTDFSFVNDSILFVSGFISDDNLTGWVIKTSDGGNSWQYITPESTLNNFSPNTIHFFDVEKGFIISENESGLTIFRTTDSGLNWQEQTLAQLSKIMEVQIINDSTAYFTAAKEYSDQTEYFFCETRDTFKTIMINSQRSYPIQSFHYIPGDSKVFALMDDSLSTRVMESSDAGLTWMEKQKVWCGDRSSALIWYLGGGAFEKIYFTPLGVGYIFSGKCIGKSTDGGGEWRIYDLNYDLVAPFFLDQNTGFVCGLVNGSHGSGIGELFITTDGGITWEHRFEIEEKIISLSFLNDAGIILSDGAIYKTTDRGTNWLESYSNNYDSLGNGFSGSDIFLFDEHNIWAVGSALLTEDLDGAVILGTENGGETWEFIWSYPNTESYYYHLSSLYTFNTTVWAVGASGLIVKASTPDSFSVINANTDLPLNDVFFIDEYNGWIAGGYYNASDDFKSVLLKTIDGGETWTEIPDFNYQINDMYFTDSLQGWAAGMDMSESGAILYTEDGGESWNKQVEGLSAPLTAMHFKDGYGWAVGGNGLILKTDGVTWVDQNTGKTYPNNFSLSQNYPNPFNPTTTIKYSISVDSKQYAAGSMQKTDYRKQNSEYRIQNQSFNQSGNGFYNVTLKVYDILGREVAILVNEQQKPGVYKVDFDGSNFSSGVYLYKLEAGDLTETKKLVLLK